MKTSLGKKIRRARETQTLTREMVCEDESEITVRQLARIESGESLPNLTKLVFLAKKLDISLNSLIDDSYIETPKEYVVLKNKIMKQTLYKDSARTEKVNLLNN